MDLIIELDDILKEIAEETILLLELEKELKHHEEMLDWYTKFLMSITTSHAHELTAQDSWSYQAKQYGTDTIEYPIV
jgi:hypothetical protein